MSVLLRSIHSECWIIYWHMNTCTHTLKTWTAGYWSIGQTRFFFLRLPAGQKLYMLLKTQSKSWACWCWGGVKSADLWINSDVTMPTHTRCLQARWWRCFITSSCDVGVTTTSVQLIGANIQTKAISWIECVYIVLIRLNMLHLIKHFVPKTNSYRLWVINEAVDRLISDVLSFS